VYYPTGNQIYNTTSLFLIPEADKLQALEPHLAIYVARCGVPGLLLAGVMVISNVPPLLVFSCVSSWPVWCLPAHMGVRFGVYVCFPGLPVGPPLRI
jgi:hypothetical protein